MVDGKSTTVEWRGHPTKICILPVGAFEQHGPHLPLATDALVAEDLARAVAEELDAALLPAQPFGTSLEQTGFRGTFTLRPETLMRIVRDLADEAEAQGFRIMVVVNGHGGNHCLLPAIRDINRSNRSLKILLLYIADFRYDVGAADRATGEMDIHAGENETSYMLARFPTLVRDERPDREPERSEMPLKQSDLTTFGMGYLNPEGVIGRASRATSEKGERIFRNVVSGMTTHIRDRVRRLEALPRYSGTVHPDSSPHTE